MRRLPVIAVCCTRPGGCAPLPGAPGLPDADAVRGTAGRGAYNIADAGYALDPVFYTFTPQEVRVDTDAAACPRACATACQTTCEGRSISRDTLARDQAGCFDVSSIPSYVTRSNTCTVVRGSPALPLGLINSGTPAPSLRCEPVAEEPVAPAGVPAAPGGTCNPPPIPANAPAKKCVFYCLQVGTGINASGLATIEGGENGSNGQRCVNVNAIRRVGTRACSSEGECACVDECKSTCGSEGGKTRCFIAPSHPDQIVACSGAGTLGQARPPVCTQEVVDGSPKTLTNPLRTTDIGELIARFIRALSGIAGSMALLMFVVGGVMWMTAEGSDRVQTAQTILKNSTMGILLIFFAYSIVSLFLSVLGL